MVAQGWNRPRARDYYDLWCILKNYSAAVNTPRLIGVLNKKCKHREVFYNKIDDFFTIELVKEANQHWQTTLGVLVRELPGCGSVLEETKLLIADLIQGSFCE